MAAEAVAPVMIFPRDIAQLKILGREQTLNEHLVNLLAFDVEPRLRASWKQEIAAKHLAFIARMKVRTGRGARSLSAADLLDWLYRGPFEHSELGYTRALIDLYIDTYPRNSQPVAEIHNRIKALHEALTPRLAGGDPAVDLIEVL